RRRHTRFSRDWSSDVCSSDLVLSMITDKARLQRFGDPMAGEEVRGRSLWADARRRFMRNRASLGGAIILVLITFLALFGDVLARSEERRVGKGCRERRATYCL